MTNQNDAINRSNCFRLLAACFYEPEKEMFIEEHVCNNLEELLRNYDASAANAAASMGSNLVIMEQHILSVDHAGLFIGPLELLAAPYGSVYREGKRQVMGETTIDVLRFYEEAGLAVDIKELPDHIAIELEFMSFLCNKESESLTIGDQDGADKYREMQIQFFQTAMQWVPQFCDSIRKGTDNSFYKDLADCLGHFMVNCRVYYEEPVVASV